MLLYKTILILSISGLILPYFCFAQSQMQIKVPETLDEAKIQAIEALKEIDKRLWGALMRVLKEDILPIWQKMWGITKNLWNSYFGPKLEYLIGKLKDFFQPKIEALWQEFLKILGKEIEKRKPGIEEEFQKEKEEIKQEIGQEIEKEMEERTPEVGKSLWERFKELIK